MPPAAVVPLTLPEKKKIESYLDDWNVTAKDKRDRIREDLAIEFLKNRQTDPDDPYARAWIMGVGTSLAPIYLR